MGAAAWSGHATAKHGVGAAAWTMEQVVVEGSNDRNSAGRAEATTSMHWKKGATQDGVIRGGGGAHVWQQERRGPTEQARGAGSGSGGGRQRHG